MRQVGHSGGPLTDAILHAKLHPLHGPPEAVEGAHAYQKGELFRHNYGEVSKGVSLG